MARRVKGEGSIYQRADGRIVGQYRVDGKLKYIYGKSKKEVKEKLDKVLEKIENNIDFESEKMSLHTWLVKWLETYIKNSVKLSTYISYEGIVRGHISKHRIGKTELAKVTTDLFQRYFNEKTKTGRLDGKQGGLSPKSLLNQYTMLNEALEQACLNGYILKNPIRGVRLPRQTHYDMRVLSMEEQKKLMNTVTRYGEMSATGISIALYTGMRLGEVLGLKWKDIDWQGREIFVSRTVNRLKTFDKDSDTATKIVIGEPKTKNSIRRIPMTKSLEVLLQQQMEKQKNSLYPADNHNYGNWDSELFIVTNESLHGFEPRTYQDLFKRYVEMAGIEDANFHALRHTFATRCIENGMDVVVLSKILGHASPATTMNKYGHALDEHKKIVMDRMENLYDDMSVSL